MNIKHILITGDFTCTTSRKELDTTKKYITFLKEEGFTIYTFPGNHDAYTKKAEEGKLFYRFLEDLVDFRGEGPFDLIRDRIAHYTLTPSWHLISIDCALSVPVAKATGLFSTSLEEKLKQVLASLPNDVNIVIAGHFPYLPHNYPKHHLERGDVLENLILSDTRIKAYIHGHRHELDLSKKATHLCIESGSVAIRKKSTLSIIELNHAITAKPYIYFDGTWIPYEK